MRLLDVSFDRPEVNLAFEEVLLDRVGAGHIPETLRFWTSPSLFVVLGVSQQLAREVDEEACRRDGVPVLRRCSAGGCVVQGPGCLNYTLVLQPANHPEMADLHGSYEYILGNVAAALVGVAGRIVRQGICDLAMQGLKVSGNAQKRRSKVILHHGTLLYGMDATHMSRYLREPLDRPEYRGDRPHQDFVGRLPCSDSELKHLIREVFHADSTVSSPKPEEIAAANQLAVDKYLAPEWTRRR